MPARSHEGERRVALLEAAILERAELEQPRADQDRRGDHPAMTDEPAELGRDGAQRCVGDVRDDAECEPGREEPEHDQREQAARRRCATAVMRRNISSSGSVVGNIIAAIISDPGDRMQSRRHDDVALRNGATQARPAPRRRPSHRRRGSGSRD